jgi:hypothetical protein
MSRRSVLVAVGIFLLLTCGGATALLLLVRYEPERYVQATVPPGPERTDQSKKFCAEFSNLISGIGSDHEWGVKFTEKQINSYFDEHFVQQGLDVRLLPEGISQPRLVIETDKIRLAFRYGSGLWSTVISIDMRVWLARNEPNVVALKLEGFHAGALPISAQSLLERISEVGRQNGIDVNWYRHEGHPVALLRFQADQAQPTMQLIAVQLGQGVIEITGRPNEPAPGRTELPAPGLALKPAAD